METPLNPLARFFGVVARGQTYLNLVYLLIAFPLGLFYFIFLVVGLSLGLPLIIIWIGLPVLLGVFLGWIGLAAMERQLAIALLHESIAPMYRWSPAGKTLWQRFTATIGSAGTWKSLVYLLLKFPLGLVSFVLLVTLLATSASLVTMPLYYAWVPVQVGVNWTGSDYTSLLVVDTLTEAVIACLVGVALLFVSLHILNGLAWVSGKIARVMLGEGEAAPGFYSPAGGAAVFTPAPPPPPAAALPAPTAPAPVEAPPAPAPGVPVENPPAQDPPAPAGDVISQA